MPLYRKSITVTNGKGSEWITFFSVVVPRGPVDSLQMLEDIAKVIGYSVLPDGKDILLKAQLTM